MFCYKIYSVFCIYLFFICVTDIIDENDCVVFAELTAVLLVLPVPVPVVIMDLEITGDHFKQEHIIEIVILCLHNGIIHQ